jgi:hypothetical protein
MKPIKIVLLITSIAAVMLLIGYMTKDTSMNQLPEISANIKKQLTFTCTHEKDRIPPRNPEAEQLYKHARWLVKGNILKQDSTVYPSIERLIRIATAYGHDKANIALREMLENSQAVSPDPVNEIIDLVQDLIKRGIPAGYYDMGWYLEHGYGVTADQELAFKYYRKSADMGSPQGQYLVGDKLSDQTKTSAEIAKIGWSMYRCAADQHYAKAANEFGIYLKQIGSKSEAIKYYQIASAEGLAVAPSSLSDAFSEKYHAHPNWGLNQAVDTEREKRYEVIEKFLSDYEYLNPKVPDIDEIVPLPPAKLPPWDGKFKWLEEHKANVPPPLPSEERIAEMARAKGLDPKTGRPLSAVK